MVPAGLINNIYIAAAHIDFGRKGFAIRGKAEEGRIYKRKKKNEERKKLRVEMQRKYK